MVARNFRSPRCRGEIDLIGWEADVLCFIEVKTRTSRDVKTAEAAVDRHKRREVAQVAREYLKGLPPTCQWRFDMVSVYYAHPGARPEIEVFRNASLSRKTGGVKYEVCATRFARLELRDRMERIRNCLS